MLTEAQKALRAGRIGSSIVAAIIGKHQSKGPHDAYAEILGISKFEGNEQTEIGDALETPIANLYAARTDHFLARGVSLVHPEHDWAIATPDFGVLSDREPWSVDVDQAAQWRARVTRNIEVKCVGEWALEGWDPDDPEGIPEHYRPQIEWQMGISGVHETDVAALLGGTRFHIWTIKQNERLFRAILSIVERFYREHIVERIPPEPDGSDAAREILQSVWPRERVPLRDADLGDELLAAQVIKAKAAKKAADQEEQRLCQLLQQRIAEAEGINGTSFKATWKWQEPTVVQSFTRKGGRVLRVTAKGAD